MATINYSEEQLKAGEKIITWSSVGPGDEGQLYDLTGHEVLSIHSHMNSAGDVNVRLFGGNANIGLSAFKDLQGFGGNDLLVDINGVTGMSGRKRPRYIAPKAASGANGAITFYILIKEDR